MLGSVDYSFFRKKVFDEFWRGAHFNRKVHFFSKSPIGAH